MAIGALQRDNHGEEIGQTRQQDEAPQQGQRHEAHVSEGRDGFLELEQETHVEQVAHHEEHQRDLQRNVQSHDWPHHRQHHLDKDDLRDSRGRERGRVGDIRAIGRHELGAERHDRRVAADSARRGAEGSSGLSHGPVDAASGDPLRADADAGACSSPAASFRRFATDVRPNAGSPTDSIPSSAPVLVANCRRLMPLCCDPVSSLVMVAFSSYIQVLGASDTASDAERHSVVSRISGPVSARRRLLDLSFFSAPRPVDPLRNR